MASLEPSFRRSPGGILLLTDTAEAKTIKNEHRERDFIVPRPAEKLRKEAQELVKKAGGDVSNPKHLLGYFTIQFGCFRGMTFRWILENSPGYAGYLVAGMEKDESKPSDNRWINKMAFKKYVGLWEEGQQLVEMKKRQKTLPTPKLVKGIQSTQEVPKSSRDLFVPTVSSQRKAMLSGDNVETRLLQKQPSMVIPCSSNTEAVICSQSTRVTSHVDSDLCLPARWKKTLPKADQLWISKTLFCWTKTGGVELVPEHLNQLWWYPPQPAVAVNHLPTVNRYFARPLFLWMPRKQWKVKLYCPHPGCDKRELASAGINQKVCQVVDIDGYYNMACDNLECMKCRRRVLSWSHAILSQLDIGHRVQFPCILTAKLACDIKIVRLLRNRGLGNSCSQVLQKIEEQHGEKWLQNVVHYLTDCKSFACAADANLVMPPDFSDPPVRVQLPKRRWLMNIFTQDVLHRLEEMKASITSVFGKVLKIDSTKKVVKKLAGRPAKTALWCTNVGNEHGQILTSVMTSGEGHGLTPMLVGIINRYSSALMSAPQVIYVDRDCCGSSPLQNVLTASKWPTVIRLDIWHFMRRIATGCTTDSHQLYSSFMGFLSNCIFHWDEQDLNLLIKSKCNELAAKHVFCKNDADVLKHVSRYELALHCRRKTRGEAETTKMIHQLIQHFSGERGRNTLGVPLINSSRMKSIWDAQKKHIGCLQDPPGVSLYTRTGSTRKGAVDLPNYRIARGSTSLESFHLHLNRFIPGTLASDVLFQAYIVDGLHRWNEDRAQQATSTEQPCYSGILCHTANVLGIKVLNRKVVPTYEEPRKYTGELIGVEYLYSQTGKVLDDCKKAIESLEAAAGEDLIEDDDEDDKELGNTDLIDDLTISTLGLKESSYLATSPQSKPVELLVPEPPSLPSVQISLPSSEEFDRVLSDTINLPSQSAPQAIEPSQEHFDEHISIEETEEETDRDTEDNESVGPNNIPGYNKVQDMAAYLISLRNDNYLTNVQVLHIVRLWDDLPSYDKAPTVFPERFSKEARGRFKAKKSVRNVAPGVESTERSIRGGPGAVPASWPNANRYTEAIFIQLLSLFPRNRTRLNDVTKAYYNIRQLVLQNAKLMSETKLQLPEISRGTLLQWHTKRGKDMDKLVVKQGVRFVEPPKTTSEGIPAALEKPKTLPTGSRDPYVFVCPENTAGMARFKKHSSTVASSTTQTRADVSIVPTSRTTSSQANLPQQSVTPQQKRLCLVPDPSAQSRADISIVPSKPITSSVASVPVGARA